MPYDPRMLQMAQRGIGMMSPQQRDAFADPRSKQQQPKQWWEQGMQPMPYVAGPGQEQGQMQPMPYASPSDPSDPSKPPQPSLLQLLMLGGKPTYSGTPQPGPQQGTANPWGWLGGMWGGAR